MEKKRSCGRRFCHAENINKNGDILRRILHMADLTVHGGRKVMAAMRQKVRNNPIYPDISRNKDVTVSLNNIELQKQ